VRPEAKPDLCLRCGRCCYAKLIIDGEVVYTPFPCPHLDAATRLCAVYERRREANPDCISLEEGIRLGVFPGDCPYVRDLPDYVPPRLELTPEEIAEFADDVAEVEHAVRRVPPPAGGKLRHG
jgi:uncharacterized cysteine cluster protein YcgN (CxxCxxCC family)